MLRLTQHLDDLAVGDAVEGFASASSVGDEAAISQALEVSGDVALRAVERVDDVAHTPLPIRKQRDDRQTCRISETAEQLGDGLDVMPGRG